MKNTLSGKKTYLISLLSVLVGVLQLLNGHSYAQVLPYIFAGAFGGSLRAAIAKVEGLALKALPSSVDILVKPVVDAEIAHVEG